MAEIQLRPFRRLKPGEFEVTPFTRLNSGALSEALQKEGVQNHLSLLEKLARDPRFHSTNIEGENMARMREMIQKFRGEKDQVRLPRAMMLNLARNAFNQSNSREAVLSAFQKQRNPTILSQVSDILAASERLKRMKKVA